MHHDNAQMPCPGVPMSAAAKQVAKELSVGRKELYDVAMQVRRTDDIALVHLQRPTTHTHLRWQSKKRKDK